MSEIEVEVDRLSQGLWRMLVRDSYVAEVPTAIHGHGPDTGHAGGSPLRVHGRGESRAAHDGLGGPEFHPRFLAYLKDAGVCLCPETRPDGSPAPHTCDRRFEGQARFRAPKRESHPRRLKRAFRQLRLLAPYDQYHICYLIVARQCSFPQALDQVNSARLARGENPLSLEDGALVVVTGIDLLESCW